MEEIRRGVLVLEERPGLFDHSNRLLSCGELGVNTAVKKLRQALEDSADHPKFIETLPRYGYRFMIPVEWMTGNGDKISPPSAVQPIGHTDHHPNCPRSGQGFFWV
jgi:DNA-binding winged helix-turn-helix (wHTH) protein